MIYPVRQYFIPLLVSIASHAVLVWMMMVNWQLPSAKPDFRKPEFVKATLVELKTKAPEKKENGSKVQKVDLVAQKRKAEAERRRQEQARQKAAKLKKQKEDNIRKKRLAKEKAAKEKAAREKAAKEKAATQREQAKREQELARKRQQEAIDKALREEEIMLAEQAEAQVVNSYKAIIMERIAQKWSRPPSARRGMRCELVIQLVPTGKIITVNVTEGSGNAAFDRSAEQAVRAVDRIPELQNMEIAIFERNFRTIHLLFNPEDRRL